jgi:hypothetical protein
MVMPEGDVVSMMSRAKLCCCHLPCVLCIYIYIHSIYIYLMSCIDDGQHSDPHGNQKYGLHKEDKITGEFNMYDNTVGYCEIWFQ